MLHFVFDWIQGSSSWSEKISPWYLNDRKIALDDSVQYVRKFEIDNMSYNSIIMHYAPQFRYYLQSQDVVTLNYWSLFDWIQEVELKSVEPVDFKKLMWPEDVQFIYNPFTTLVFSNNEMIAKVEFGNYGQLIWIDYYEEKKLIRRHVWDDRGFTSSIEYFDSYQNITQRDYLTVSGSWALRENKTENSFSIDVNPKYEHKFKLRSYSSFKNLFEELLNNNEYFMSEDDQLLFPYKQEVFEVLKDIKVRHKNMFVSYSNTLSADKFPLDNTFSNIIAANHAQINKLEETYSEHTILYMAPSDTRVQLNQSKRIKGELLLIVLDKQSLEQFNDLAIKLKHILKNNENVRLRFIMINDTKENQLDLIQLIEKSVLSPYYKLLYGQESTELGLSTEESLPLDEIISEPLIIKNEIELLELLRFTRLTIDLSIIQNDYVKIASLTAGIPMILNKPSRYIEHMKNGWILENVNQMDKAINYFSSTLNNWNNASLAAIKQMDMLSKQSNFDALYLKTDEGRCKHGIES